MKDSKNISQLSGYKVPTGYFKNFSVGGSDVESSYGHGFKVPDNYFDSFTVKPPQPAKVIHLYNYKSIAVAAILIVILSTMLINLISMHQANQSLDFSKIDKSQLYDYLEDEMYLDHDLYINSSVKSSPESTLDFSEDEVLDYLDDSTIEQLIDY